MRVAAIFFSSLVALSVSQPFQKRAVFTTKTYDELSISGGVAGDAEAEALAALSGLPDDLTTVEQADLDFLDSVNQIANDAETGAFNPAIESATGDEADALQRGKIKNKVLKLTATVLKLNAQAAQGKNVTAKLAKEETKLAKNVALDVEAAGLASTALSFDATTS